MLSFSDAELKSDKLIVKSLLDQILHCAREHLAMEVAFISEFKDGERIFRLVDSAQNASGLLEVDCAGALEDSYCQRVVDGRLPNLIHNAVDLVEACKLSVTTALSIGAHLSVQIYLDDGSVFGTFCCFSCKANYQLTSQDLSYFRVFAELSSSLIKHFVAEDRKRLVVRHNIQHILDTELFSMVYQPIFDLNNRNIVGYEALTRFESELPLSTEEWFEAAVEAGMSEQLECAVIKKALHNLPLLQADQYLSINVSPTTILNCGYFSTLLPADKLSRILLEVSEHERIDDYSKVAGVLAPYRQSGLRLAVYDAGSGFASFRHILQLQPDVIKIDRSLIKDVDSNQAELALTAAIVKFANTTGCTIIAEGVETECERNTLFELGVCCAQGYLLGRPQAL